MTQIERIWTLQQAGISLPSAVFLVQFITSPYYKRGDKGFNIVAAYLRLLA